MVTAQATRSMTSAASTVIVRPRRVRVPHDPFADEGLALPDEDLQPTASIMVVIPPVGLSAVEIRGLFDGSFGRVPEQCERAGTRR